MGAHRLAKGRQMMPPRSETPDQQDARELSEQFPLITVQSLLGGFVAAPRGTEVMAGAFRATVAIKINEYLSRPNPPEVAERLSWLGSDELDGIMHHVYAVLDLGDVLPRDLYESLYVFGLQVIRAAGKAPVEDVDVMTDFDEKD